MNRFKSRVSAIVTAAALAATVALTSGCSASQTQQLLCSPASNSNPTGTAPANASLVQAIKSDTVGNIELTAAMVFGPVVETGFNPAEIGKAGGFGAFQIQEPGVVHPDITQEQALDPAYATNYMLPSYENALKNVPPALWVTNPMLAMEDTAINAERPFYRYDDYQHNGRPQDLVPNAYQTTLQIMQQQMGLSTNFGSATLVNKTTVSAGASSSASPASGGCNIAQLVNDTGATGARNTVVQAAYAELGVPYSYAAGNAQGKTFGVCNKGDAGWNDCNIQGFDCSGLVLYAFAKVGITFPHLAATQYDDTKANTVATSVDDLSRAQPGDLVFFAGSDGTQSAPGHVGIYIGDGQMINAPESGENVSIVSITSAQRRVDFVAITNPYGSTTAVPTH